MTNRPNLSVIVPLFNEEESIPALFESLSSACQALGHPYEIVFVDDGSSDQTPSLLAELNRVHSGVRVVLLRKNYGQTAAMAAGFRAARGTFVVSMDGDMQNDPADIPRLLDKLGEGYDVVCGWRKDRKDKLFSRRVPSLVANWLISKITGVPIHDNGCSLKAYRRTVVKRLPLYADFHRFIPAMSTLRGAKVTELVVTHHSRKFGASKYGISRAWLVCLDLFVVSILVGFASHPSRWFARMSGAIFFVGLGVGAAIVLSEGSGIVLLSLVFMTFALAGHLLALGLLGEMFLFMGSYRPDPMLLDTDKSMKSL